jgi:hypothetical protein
VIDILQWQSTCSKRSKTADEGQVIGVKYELIMKYNEHWWAELYLERLTFGEELKRCCGEVYSSLFIWGFSTTKLDSMK